MPLCTSCPHCLTPNTEIIVARLTNGDFTFSCAKKYYEHAEGRKFPYEQMNRINDYVERRKDCPKNPRK